MPVLSQQGNLCRRLWGGREETITSAILSEGGEGGRGKKTWQGGGREQWVRGPCRAEPICNLPFVYGAGALEIHNLSEGTLVCGGVCLTS